MAALVERAKRLVESSANTSRLDHLITYHDVFHHCENDPDAARVLEAAVRAEGIPIATTELPMRGSEDFGRFGGHARSAMFLLGSGTDSPSLHNPDFDFPDDLIAVGGRVLVRTIKNLCCERLC